MYDFPRTALRDAGEGRDAHPCKCPRILARAEVDAWRLDRESEGRKTQSPRESMSSTTPDYDPARRGRPLAEIETWIFDLDNTLYPASCNLFVEAEARMAAFIVAELKLELEAAHALRRRFFLDHGTTLRGLMLEHDIPPER